jgi:hypothetical protein
MTRTDASNRALTGSVGDLKVLHTLYGTFAGREELATRPRPGSRWRRFRHRRG